ncbi:protein AUXIN RESPONSE 4 [Selaginella moellendorffii]|uniref:protein AUXIN RESPONSE 4 n=1 Tax=Selaginella moellendorffii TaxID=88036 RepID=UPI000D1C508E|nr:protein AUXIN RESPONSE 4 [Selaginella moellendorffii]|eukprot:XP_024534297.1 protein AUXIN RESPONSE 4 [Selaginella moellendorffii]
MSDGGDPATPPPPPPQQPPPPLQQTPPVKKKLVLVIGMVVAILAVMVSALVKDDEEGPLAMPAVVRQHFLGGKFVKVEVGWRTVRVFATTSDPDQAQELGDGAPVVVLLHGMGSSSFIYRKVQPLLAAAGFRVVALDLPGSGLSDKFTLEEWKRELGGLEWLAAAARAVVKEIADKGFLWRLEQMFETGALPAAATRDMPAEKVEIVKWPVGGDTQEQAQALAQLLRSLLPIQDLDLHLVAHDTASEVARAYSVATAASSMRVRSVTILDSSPARPALPVLLLGSPGVGSALLRSTLAYAWLVRRCCMPTLPVDVARAHAFLLRRGNGRAALLEMARMANSSVTPWRGADIAMQLLWACGWSEQWKTEGERASQMLAPGSLFRCHTGSRWPQEDVPQEVSDAIKNLVSSTKSKTCSIQAGDPHACTTAN